MYGCVFHKEDGFCEKFCDDRCKSYCVMGPCRYAIPSNADRIRAMTDEELAEHLYRWDNSPLHASRERWLDWLKAPVEEVDNG